MKPGPASQAARPHARRWAPAPRTAAAAPRPRPARASAAGQRGRPGRRGRPAEHAASSRPGGEYTPRAPGAGHGSRCAGRRAAPQRAGAAGSRGTAAEPAPTSATTKAPTRVDSAPGTTASVPLSGRQEGRSGGVGERDRDQQGEPVAGPRPAAGSSRRADQPGAAGREGRRSVPVGRAPTTPPPTPSRAPWASRNSCPADRRASPAPAPDRESAAQTSRTGMARATSPAPSAHAAASAPGPSTDGRRACSPARRAGRVGGTRLAPRGGDGRSVVCVMALPTVPVVPRGSRFPRRRAPACEPPRRPAAAGPAAGTTKAPAREGRGPSSVDRTRASA